MREFRHTVNQVLWVLALVSLASFAESDKAYIRSIKKHRKARKKEFKDPDRSPLREKATNFKGFSYYPIDPEYCVTAHLEKTPQSKPFQLPTSDPTVAKTYVSFAKAHFTLKGEKYHLTIYRSLQLIRIPTFRDYLFLPFRDSSSGRASYGGGRYLDLKEIQGDSLVIDFNLAYNPNCAYSAGWACPIPPAENVLSIPIEAGEKNYPYFHE